MIQTEGIQGTFLCNKLPVVRNLLIHSPIVGFEDGFVPHTLQKFLCIVYHQFWPREPRNIPSTLPTLSRFWILTDRSAVSSPTVLRVVWTKFFTWRLHDIVCSNCKDRLGTSGFSVVFVYFFKNNDAFNSSHSVAGVATHVSGASRARCL